jgi:hypothetical protein
MLSKTKEFLVMMSLRGEAIDLNTICKEESTSVPPLSGYNY